MIYKTIKLFLFLVMAFLLCACPGPSYPEFPVDEVQGYKPVYADDAEVQIEFQQSRALQKPGKIYIYEKYLLVNEPFEGIHVFNNENPEDPVSLGFIRIYGNVDMAVRNNILYVDHIGDLVALDISDLNSIKEVSRIQSSWNDALPPGESTYFECVDPLKGNVIGWELTILKKPECYK